MPKATLILYKIEKFFRRIFTRRAFGFYTGALISYLVAYFFAGKETDGQGIFPSIIFNAGDLEIHLHHWLFSSILLVLLILPLFLKGKINPSLFTFVFGFSIGLIIHGVFSYSDWKDIINQNIHLIDNYDFKNP